MVVQQQVNKTAVPASQGAGSRADHQEVPRRRAELRAPSSIENDAPSRAAGLHDEKFGELGTLEAAPPVEVKGAGKLVEGKGKVRVSCNGSGQGALFGRPGRRGTDLEENRGVVAEVPFVAGLR